MTEIHRTNDPAMIAEIRQYTQEARSWVRSWLLAYLAGGAWSEPLTVGQVMAKLDWLPDKPAGYIYYLSSAQYTKRHGLVNGQLQRLVRELTLETSTTTNAKGRSGVACYGPASAPPTFEVIVEGTPKNPQIRDAFLRAVSDHAHSLRGVEAIRIVRVPAPATGVH